MGYWPGYGRRRSGSSRPGSGSRTRSHPGFDRWADDPGRTAGWRRCTLDASHLAYVTSPDAVAKVLLDLVETG